MAGVDGCPGEGRSHRGWSHAPDPPGVGNSRAIDCRGSEVNHRCGAYNSVVTPLRGKQRYPRGVGVGIGGVITSALGDVRYSIWEEAPPVINCTLSLLYERQAAPEKGQYLQPRFLGKHNLERV